MSKLLGSSFHVCFEILIFSFLIISCQCLGVVDNEVVQPLVGAIEQGFVARTRATPQLMPCDYKLIAETNRLNCNTTSRGHINE